MHDLFCLLIIARILCSHRAEVVVLGRQRPRGHDCKLCNYTYNLHKQHYFVNSLFQFYHVFNLHVLHTRVLLQLTHIQVGLLYRYDFWATVCKTFALS